LSTAKSNAGGSLTRPDGNFVESKLESINLDLSANLLVGILGFRKILAGLWDSVINLRSAILLLLQTAVELVVFHKIPRRHLPKPTERTPPRVPSCRPPNSHKR
jgi:hypothetical protein